MSIIPSQNKATSTEWALSWLDYIPVVSTIANIAHMILRSSKSFDPKASDYGKFLQLRDFSGHAVRSIPVINLIASAILDSRRKESGLTNFALANDETKALEAISIHSNQKSICPDQFQKLAGYFAYISDDLKNSPEFALKAVESNPWVYTYLPTSLKTEKLLLEVVAKNPDVFMELPANVIPNDIDHYLEFAMKCAKANYKVIQYFSPDMFTLASLRGKKELRESAEESIKSSLRTHNVPIEEIHKLNLLKYASQEQLIDGLKKNLYSLRHMLSHTDLGNHEQLIQNLIKENPEYFQKFIQTLHTRSDRCLSYEIYFIKCCLESNIQLCIYLSDKLIEEPAINEFLKDVFENRKENKELLASLVSRNVCLLKLLPLDLLVDEIYIVVECLHLYDKNGDPSNELTYAVLKEVNEIPQRYPNEFGVRYKFLYNGDIAHEYEVYKNEIKARYTLAPNAVA